MRSRRRVRTLLGEPGGLLFPEPQLFHRDAEDPSQHGKRRDARREPILLVAADVVRRDGPAGVGAQDGELAPGQTSRLAEPLQARVPPLGPWRLRCARRWRRPYQAQRPPRTRAWWSRSICSCVFAQSGESVIVPTPPPAGMVRRPDHACNVENWWFYGGGRRQQAVRWAHHTWAWPVDDESDTPIEALEAEDEHADAEPQLGDAGLNGPGGAAPTRY